MPRQTATMKARNRARSAAAVLTGRDVEGDHSMIQAETVLLLADRRRSHTDRALRAAGYHVILSFTADHAVAVCVGNSVDAVVLDQEHFVVTQNWSVAQSLKMIKPRICVVLMARGKIVNRELPAGIDAIVAEGDTKELLSKLEQLF